LILSYRFSSAKSTRFSIIVIDRTKIKYYRLQGVFQNSQGYVYILFYAIIKEADRRISAAGSLENG
jgi:hypothetical protein